MTCVWLHIYVTCFFGFSLHLFNFFFFFPVIDFFVLFSCAFDPIKEERFCEAVRRLEFDRHLGPYNLSQYATWKRLSNYITKSTIEWIGTNVISSAFFINSFLENSIRFLLFCCLCLEGLMQFFICLLMVPYFLVLSIVFQFNCIVV